MVWYINLLGVEMQDGEIENSESGELREQDRFLPIANVARIMKKGIPSQGKIAKDARECVQECVSEFISFITSEASDRCQAEKVMIVYFHSEIFLCILCLITNNNLKS